MRLIPAVVARGLLGLGVALAPLACAVGGNEGVIDYGKGDSLPPDGTDEAGDDAGLDTEPPPADGGTDTATSKDTAPPPADAVADTIFPKDDAGCTPTCGACGAADGCGGTCLTGSCAGGTTCVAGTCLSPTVSYASPQPFQDGSGFARSFTMTVDSEAAAKIFFTTDGSAPGATSKPSPADFIVSGSTTVKWYADDGVKEGTHSLAITLDATEQGRYGFLVDKVALNGSGPVVTVSPGATVSGKANVLAWNNPGCPSCRMQVLVGIASASACLYDWSPDKWPGASTAGAAFSVKAPATAGLHKVTVSYQLETGCANGITKGFRAYKADVGFVIVK